MPALALCRAKPFTPVEADLNVKRQPALQSHVHEPKIAIRVVEVEKQALAVLAEELELAAWAPSDAKALADLHTSKHADQTVADPITLGDLQSDLILVACARLQIVKGPAQILGDLLGMCLQLIRQPLGEGAKIGVSNTAGGKEVLQSVGITDRTQATAKQQAVVSMEYSDDLPLLTIHKRSHGTPRLVWKCKIASGMECRGGQIQGELNEAGLGAEPKDLSLTADTAALR
jgi:hypothetical protein